MSQANLQREPDRTRLTKAARVDEKQNVLVLGLSTEEVGEMKLENLAWKQYLLALSTVVLILASVSWAGETDPDHTDIGKRIEKSAAVPARVNDFETQVHGVY